MGITKTVDFRGDIEYRNERGDLHREDGPAVITPYGHKEWWINDFLHREDGPAVIYPEGYKEYWLHGCDYEYEEWLDRVTNPIMYKWREYCESNYKSIS